LIEVIPVLDIMGGLVVHAIAGRREEYKPLKESVLADKPDPHLILKNLKNMGFKTVYIADLDAIMGRGGNSYVIHVAETLNFNVLADVGRVGLSLTDTDKISYVIGTEYMRYPNELELLNGRVVSLDMYGGEVLFSNTRRSVDEVIEDLRMVEFRKVLVIDLSRVGTGSGVNKAIISELIRYFPGKLIVGGGVREEGDILYLRDVGVVGVLVATAIHKGVIRRPVY
jgi:phosphoribosylformimino-5-aminoimidazole carboxamide ribotide isomerase